MSPAERKTAEKYKDIIHATRPEPIRPRMDLVNRAKIFSPYDALRGFDEEIAETEEKTRQEQRIFLSEEEKASLSDKLLQVKKGMSISVRYFQPETSPDIGISYTTDLEKYQAVDIGAYQTSNFEEHQTSDLGKYRTLSGIVMKIDPISRELEILESRNGHNGKSDREDDGMIRKEIPTRICFDDLIEIAGTDTCR